MPGDYRLWARQLKRGKLSAAREGRAIASLSAKLVATVPSRRVGSDVYSLPVRLPFSFGVTEALVLICFLVFAAMGFPLRSSGPSQLLNWGSSWGPLSLDGQWWRMFTTLFVHDGLEHILANVLPLWVAGRRVESTFGKWPFLFLYFASGLAGTIVTLALRPERYHCGSSGAVLGITGAWIAAQCTRRPAPSARESGTIFWLFMAFMAAGLSWGAMDPGVNSASHVGGLLTGLLLGTLLSSGVGSARVRTGVYCGASVLLVAATFLVRHENRWVISLRTAKEELASDRLDDAARNFKLVLAARPNDIAANVALGDIYLRKGDYTDAEFFLKRALTADSNNNVAEYLLGRVYLQMGRFDEVLDISERLFLRKAIGPDEQALFAAALEGKGSYALAGDRYLKLNRYDEAIASFQKAVNKNPDDLFSRQGLAKAYRAKGMNAETK